MAQFAIWFVYLIQLGFTGSGGNLAAYIFLGGPRAVQFWFFQLVIGLILPLALMCFQSLRENPLASLVAGAATMIGAFFAVANLSIGSQLIPLTHLQWEQMAPEPFKTAFGLVIMAILLALFLLSYKILPYEKPVAQKSEA